MTDTLLKSLEHCERHAKDQTVLLHAVDLRAICEALREADKDRARLDWFLAHFALTEKGQRGAPISSLSLRLVSNCAGLENAEFIKAIDDAMEGEK